MERKYIRILPAQFKLTRTSEALEVQIRSLAISLVLELPSISVFQSNVHRYLSRGPTFLTRTPSMTAITKRQVPASDTTTGRCPRTSSARTTVTKGCSSRFGLLLPADTFRLHKGMATKIGIICFGKTSNQVYSYNIR